MKPIVYEKRKNKYGNSRYITTNTELKDFAKQVGKDKFGDKHFEKAYEKFRTPAYGMKGEQHDRTGSN